MPRFRIDLTRIETRRYRAFITARTGEEAKEVINALMVDEEDTLFGLGDDNYDEDAKEILKINRDSITRVGENDIVLGEASLLLKRDTNE